MTQSQTKLSARLLRANGRHFIEITTPGDHDYEIGLDDAEALLGDLFAAVDGWKGIVRPSKPLSRWDRLLGRLGLRRA
jgi:hypothetical protein